MLQAIEKINADFLHSEPGPPIEYDGIDSEGPSRFINREMSWLAFNWRVLSLATKATMPLLERLRMLSISGSNLDEFYTVRVAGLRELVRGGITHPAIDGLSPAEQLSLIDADARRLLDRQQQIWLELKTEMEAAGITLLNRQNLTREDRTFLLEVFTDQIFPVLSPLAIDPAHPFPFLPTGGQTLALQLQRTRDKRPLQALLPIPHQIDRFIALPDTPSGGQRLIVLEDVLLEFINRLFPGYSIRGHCSFRILRDSDLEVEEEAEDLVREFETALKRRRRGEVIVLTITKDAPEALRSLVLRELKVGGADVVDCEGSLGLGNLSHPMLEPRRDLQ